MTLGFNTTGPPSRGWSACLIAESPAQPLSWRKTRKQTPSWPVMPMGGGGTYLPWKVLAQNTGLLSPPTMPSGVTDCPHTSADLLD